MTGTVDLSVNGGYMAGGSGFKGVQHPSRGDKWSVGWRQGLCLILSCREEGVKPL